MNITSTQLQKPSFQSSAAPKEHSTFGIEIDPFSGIKKAIEDGVELSGAFVSGGVPAFGAKHLFERGFSAGYSGNGTNMKLGYAGAALNALGSASLVVGAAQSYLNSDPTIALGVSLVALGGAGLASAIMKARQ